MLVVRVQLCTSRGQCVSKCSSAVEAVKRVEVVLWRILYRLTLCSTRTCTGLDWTGLEVFRPGVRRSHQDRIQQECRMQNDIHASTLTSPTQEGWRMQTLQNLLQHVRRLVKDLAMETRFLQRRLLLACCYKSDSRSPVWCSSEETTTFGDTSSLSSDSLHAQWRLKMLQLAFHWDHSALLSGARTSTTARRLKMTARGTEQAPPRGSVSLRYCNRELNTL